MPIFTDKPPEPNASYPLRIVRTPATGSIVGIITCTDVVGCNTHYAANRTVPCEGESACKFCSDGYSWRWHGYVSAMLLPSLEHVLFEFTAASCDTFRNYHLIHNTMRACRFRAQRASKRPNGRVMIETRPDDESRLRLPDPPDIRRILCHIWNVRYNPEQPTIMPRPPFKTVDVDDDRTDGRYRA